MRPGAHAVRRSIVGTLGGLAVLGLGALIGSSAPAAVGRAVTASVPGCRTSGLVVWLDTRANGTAGATFYTLKFTNLSGRTCTLRGYAGVSAINLGGRQVGQAAQRDTAVPVRTLTIRNGATASAVLEIVETGNFPTSSCGPVTAAGLKIFVPNQSSGTTIPFPFSACSRSRVSYLRIRAVT